MVITVINSYWIYKLSFVVCGLFNCVIRLSLLSSFSGETCILLYGVLRWEIAGEILMTLPIHGKGRILIFLPNVCVHHLKFVPNNSLSHFPLAVWSLEQIWMKYMQSMQGLAVGMVFIHCRRTKLFCKKKLKCVWPVSSIFF